MPHALRRELPAERMLSAGEVRGLFAGWAVDVQGFDGPAVALTYRPASLALGAARNFPALRPLLAASSRDSSLLYIRLVPSRGDAPSVLAIDRPYPC